MNDVSARDIQMFRSQRSSASTSRAGRPELSPHSLPNDPQRIRASRAVNLAEDAEIDTGVSMNWKVNTIANRDNGKRRPEGEPPIRLASRDALSAVWIAKSPERVGAMAVAGVTLVEGALERSTLETEGVRVQGEDASSFMVAIQTARDSESLRGRPLEAVALNYSVNLLPLRELIAQVCVASKRNYASDEEKVRFSVGDLHLDASRHLVQKRGRPLHLTPKEFVLLYSLMMNAGKPVPHRKLLRSVWGPQYGCERVYLRIFIRQLRIKIEDNPTNPQYILTVPNIGYRFAESVERDAALSSSE